MPILLLLLGVATFAIVAANNQKPPPPRTFTLDNSMPPDLRNQVLSALVTENDPAKLEAFANAIASTYPLASSQLHAKAAALGGNRPIFPPMPLPAQPTPSGSSVLEIGQLPEPTRSQVLQQLAAGNDPATLESFASQLAAISPAAASALRLRASLLRSVPTMPIPSAPPSPQATDVAPPQAFPASPAPTAPAAPTALPSGFGLDPGMPPDLAQAVMNALTRETDPTKLRGFAASIASQFPIAAALLTAKANTLAVLVPPAAPVPMPAPMPTGVPAFAPSTSGTYVVQSGDFPIKIARKLVHDEARWPELVAANPTKKRAPDGNFATLLPGEVLQLPASWGVPPTFEAVSLPRIATPMLASGHIYVVQPGDFPIKIAQKLIHDGHRWHELIAANPAKKRASDGNFASLQPGERLQLPASWTATQPPFLLNPGGSHDAASA